MSSHPAPAPIHKPTACASARPAGPALKLSFSNRQPSRPVDLRWLRRLAEHVLVDLLGVEQADLGVHLVSAAATSRLNQQFLGHAGPTDVISFDYTQPPGATGRRLTRSRAAGHTARRAVRPGPLWGDIVICVEQALAQARRFRSTWQAELARYLIHGLLHLLGYDDTNPAARRQMKRQENRLLRQAARHIPLRRLARGQPGLTRK